MWGRSGVVAAGSRHDAAYEYMHVSGPFNS
ncbi:hypothetical protein CMMCA001_12975 [Clavibacter michiganensis subsp. michiganensis]|nr:hypothetical protein CMMCAS04_12495 [Clavibacter michiganensis subsp. michiganensis]OUE17757.1 hypothetical protein CMMCA001_12975 [Clavibacter michiganensis subsp. michiganensis]